ncbi:MAG: signal peptidase II [Alphaproteobacteria bacterium]|nr:MAG: signal peptidase II [Alphaproteobacteria bacterium]
MSEARFRFSLWGPLSPLGLGVAVVALLADQLHKWWMLHVYGIEGRGTVAVTPFLDLVMVWNPGISYGLFPQGSLAGRAVLIAIALAAVISLTLWLSQVHSRIGAVGIGLVIGGAIGNAIDRLLYGAVADFFSFHAFGYSWYVFNVADAAIVAGVAGLLYESLFGSHKKVSKPS